MYNRGMVNGSSYGCQQRCTACDTCKSWHLIWNQFFDKFDGFVVLTCIYQSLKCLDLKIWWFFVDHAKTTMSTTTTTEPIIVLPLVHAWGKLANGMFPHWECHYKDNFFCLHLIASTTTDSHAELTLLFSLYQVVDSIMCHRFKAVPLLYYIWVPKILMIT